MTIKELCRKEPMLDLILRDAEKYKAQSSNPPSRLYSLLKRRGSEIVGFDSNSVHKELHTSAAYECFINELARILW